MARPRSAAPPTLPLLPRLLLAAGLPLLAAAQNATTNGSNTSSSSATVDLDPGGCGCADLSGWVGMYGGCASYRLDGANEGYCADDGAEHACRRSCGACGADGCGGSGGRVSVVVTAAATGPADEVDMVLMMMVGVPLIVRDPPPYNLSYNTMALITTDCDAMRSLGIKWP